MKALRQRRGGTGYRIAGRLFAPLANAAAGALAGGEPARIVRGDVADRVELLERAAEVAAADALQPGRRPAFSAAGEAQALRLDPRGGGSWLRWVTP